MDSSTEVSLAPFGNSLRRSPDPACDSVMADDLGVARIMRMHRTEASGMAVELATPGTCVQSVTLSGAK